MLSNYDFEILSMARGENGVEAKKVNDFCNTPAKNEAFDSLLRRGLIYADGADEADSRYYLSGEGRAAYRAYIRHYVEFALGIGLTALSILAAIIWQ